MELNTVLNKVLNKKSQARLIYGLIIGVLILALVSMIFVGLAYELEPLFVVLLFK